MLVLSRKTNESIVVDGNIEITVLEIRHGVIRLGIDAPREVSVVRSELCDSESGRSNMKFQPRYEPIVDAPSDRIMHSFCERWRTWRSPAAVGTASGVAAESLEVGTNGGLCFG